jgi:hypothetical protein
MYNKYCPSLIIVRLDKSVPGLHYWNIYGVKYTTVNIFQDGVHSNQIDLQRYYRNARGAIIQSHSY